MTTSGRAKQLGRHSSQPEQDDERWARECQDAEHTRLARVQSSANVWLGILSTLFGLSGVVVLVSGSTAFVSAIHDVWLQWGLIVLVAAGFGIAILALIMGGAATWGGLANPADSNPPAHPQLDKFIVKFGASDSKETIEKYRSSSPATYKDKYNRSADRRRAYLHTSRRLGVAAALVAGCVVIWIFAAGIVSQTSPDVIVVHHGQVTCGPIRNMEKYVQVTQVISVAQC
jgi:hypothetical protein